jgi:hypothetical protein
MSAPVHATPAARQSAKSAPARAGILPPLVNEVLRSPGEPLDAVTREFMEPRFGHSFADVRVHTDPQAASSASAVAARAYAVGKDLVFGAGMFAPKTTGGQRLLAHELAHVVQQCDSGSSPAQEHEADAVAAESALNQNQPVHIRTRSGIGLARQPIFPERSTSQSPEALLKEVLFQKSCTTAKGFEAWLAAQHLERYYWMQIAPLLFPDEHPSRPLPMSATGLMVNPDDFSAPVGEPPMTMSVPGRIPSAEEYAVWQMGQPKTDEQWAEQGDLVTGSILGTIAMTKGDRELAAFGNSIIQAAAADAGASEMATANQNRSGPDSPPPAIESRMDSEPLRTAEVQPDPPAAKTVEPDYRRSGPLDKTQPQWAFDKTAPEFVHEPTEPQMGFAKTEPGTGAVPVSTAPKAAGAGYVSFAEPEAATPAEVRAAYKANRFSVQKSGSDFWHEYQWKKNGGQGTAPIAFRTAGGMIRVNEVRWLAVGDLSEINTAEDLAPTPVRKVPGKKPAVDALAKTGEAVDARAKTMPPEPAVKPGRQTQFTPPPQPRAPARAPAPRGYTPVPMDVAIEAYDLNKYVISPSYSTKFHQQVWHDGHGEGTAPVAYRVGDQIRVDVSRWPVMTRALIGQ